MAAVTELQLGLTRLPPEARDLLLLLSGGRHCRIVIQRLVVYVDLSAVIGKPHTKYRMVLRLGWYLGFEDQWLICWCLGELRQCRCLLSREGVIHSLALLLENRWLALKDVSHIGCLVQDGLGISGLDDVTTHILFLRLLLWILK